MIPASYNDDTLPVSGRDDGPARPCARSQGRGCARPASEGSLDESTSRLEGMSGLREGLADLRQLEPLQALWSRHRMVAGRVGPADNNEVTVGLNIALDRLVIFGLGLGLNETLRYLFSQQPSFDVFLAWILDCHGGAMDPARIAEVNDAVAQARGQAGKPLRALPADFTQVLDDAALCCWAERGYVVVRNAVSPEACRAAEGAIWEFLGAHPHKPDSWYGKAGVEGITALLTRHPAFDATRRSPRIRAAFAQLWGTDALQVTVDRGGFNPPERLGWQFPASDIHWDTSLALPMPFQLQGLLYLSDTPAEGGAFRCVPGFHRRLESWLAGLPPGMDPRAWDFSAEAEFIAGNAGDFIIWHAALPHGASPNRGTRPRLVQYINFIPPTVVDCRPWV